MGWTSLLRDSSCSSAAMCVRNAAIRHVVARRTSIYGPVTARRNCQEDIAHRTLPKIWLPRPNAPKICPFYLVV